jgi:WD40 repeat protein
MRGELLLSRVAGHTSPITTVEISRDGASLFSGGYDGRVICWTKELLTRWCFQAPQLVNHVKLNRADNLLSVACADTYVYVLDAASGALISQLGPHNDDVNSVAWPFDTDVLLSSCDDRDREIRLWDVRTQQVMTRLCGHDFGIPCLSPSPNGDAVVSAAEDGTCRIWSLSQSRQVALLKHPADPETASWSPCGKYVATGCNDGTLRLWDAVSFSELGDWRTSAAVRSVCFARDSSAIYAGSYNGTVSKLTVPTLRQVSVQEAPFQWERGLAASNGTLVVGSFAAKPIVVEGNNVACVGRPTSGINGLCIFADRDCKSRLLLAADSGQLLEPLRSQSWMQVETILNVVSVDPSARCAALGSYRGDLLALDLDSGRFRRTHVPGGPVNSISWLNDNSFITASYDGQLRIFDRELDMIDEWGAHDGPIKSVACDIESGLVVTGSSDNSIKLWNGASCLQTFRDPSLVLVNSVAIQSSEKTIASASRDGLVRLWSAASGRLLEALPRLHGRSVKSVAIHPTEHIICSGSYDGRVILWRKDHKRGSWFAKVLLSDQLPGVSCVSIGRDCIAAGSWTGFFFMWSLEGELIHWGRGFDEEIGSARQPPASLWRSHAALSCS